MRDIKFRAWCATCGKFRDPSGYEIRNYKGGLEAWCLNHQIHSEILLLQFTGLKDKNGKDIYEGDIGKHNGWIVDVRWNGKFAYFYLEFLKSQFKNNYRIRLGECYSTTNLEELNLEIIGNIYENPELI